MHAQSAKALKTLMAKQARVNSSIKANSSNHATNMHGQVADSLARLQAGQFRIASGSCQEPGRISGSMPDTTGNHAEAQGTGVAIQPNSRPVTCKFQGKKIAAALQTA